MANGYTDADIALLESRLAGYLQTEQDIQRNQEYQLPDRRRIMRAQLTEVRKAISDIQAELRTARGAMVTRGRARRGVLMS